MNPKQGAAQAAIDELASDQIVGLGTGSTAEYFLVALAEALRSGRLKNIRGVPTSVGTENRARELGIPIIGFSQLEQIDVTIDGADEIAPGLNLIKGLGGALLREKVVAQNSKRLIIIADSSKVVSSLGTKGPLPVEVTVFGFEAHERFLRKLGCEPKLRRKASGEPFITDNGNFIFDCRFKLVERPHDLDRALADHAGIVESGLFLGLAKLAIIGGDDEVERRTN